MEASRSILIVLALMTSGPVFSAEYQLDQKAERVLALRGLASSDGCSPDDATGWVVQRSFDKTGMNLSSFVMEARDGSRTLINVMVDGAQDMDRATAGWVQRGLQTLLREGAKVAVRYQMCGASGGVMFLDAVRNG